MRKILAVVVLACQFAWSQPSYIYKTSLVQAAPGRLLDLIELFRDRRAMDSANGEPQAFWMRHAQGDKWDILILTPIGTYSHYYSPDRVHRRNEEKARALNAQIGKMVAWQEDVFVKGPPLEEIRKKLSGASFFHVEMFIALPGKADELYKEREMENAYQRALKRPENLIFVRDQGAAWDMFTLGGYRDLKHYAESADISPVEQDAAAKSAGFEAANRIGPYLRTLIREHHDTLGNLVN